MVQRGYLHKTKNKVLRFMFHFGLLFFKIYRRMEIVKQFKSAPNYLHLLEVHFKYFVFFFQKRIDKSFAIVEHEVKQQFAYSINFLLLFRNCLNIAKFPFKKFKKSIRSSYTLSSNCFVRTLSAVVVYYGSFIFK